MTNSKAKGGIRAAAIAGTFLAATNLSPAEAQRDNTVTIRSVPGRGDVTFNCDLLLPDGSPTGAFVAAADGPPSAAAGMTAGMTRQSGLAMFVHVATQDTTPICRAVARQIQTGERTPIAGDSCAPIEAMQICQSRR